MSAYSLSAVGHKPKQTPICQTSMTQANDELARIEQLELKMMDLEDTLQQLNDVVLRQYRDIEQLRQLNTDLERKLESMNEPGASPSAADEVPPHY